MTDDTWIADVADKLRSALEKAAASKPFVWDKPDGWPSLHYRVAPIAIDKTTGLATPLPSATLDIKPLPTTAARWLQPDHAAAPHHGGRAPARPQLSEDTATSAEQPPDRPSALSGLAFGLAADFWPVTLRAAMEWENDVDTYSLPNTEALQEMANTTLYSRRQWITAWVASRSYRNAIHRGEVPNLAAWLDPMRQLLYGRTLAAAAAAADALEYWNTPSTHITLTASTGRLITALREAAAGIIALARELDPKTCHHRPPCFCRPAPFPAARDYRRRTRHRNRRRK